jgi:hypothetical protein
VIESAVVLGWVAVTGFIGLNGFAAGVVAVLQAWRSGMRRGSRIFVASATSALLPASYMIVIPAMTGTSGEEFGIMILSSAVIFAFATVVSLPGAIIVSRKLVQPGDEYRTFE